MKHNLIELLEKLNQAIIDNNYNAIVIYNNELSIHLEVLKKLTF